MHRKIDNRTGKLFLSLPDKILDSRDSMFRGERGESRTGLLLWPKDRQSWMEQQRNVDILFRALMEILDKGRGEGDWIFAGIDLEINS